MKLIIIIIICSLSLSCNEMFNDNSKSSAYKSFFQIKQKDDNDEYLENLNSSNNYLKYLIIEELKKKNSNVFIPQILEHFKKETDPKTLVELVKLVNYIDFFNNIEFFVKNLSHHEAIVRIGCLEIITSRVGLGHKDKIVEKLNDEDSNVRVTACRSIQYLRIADALPKLIELLMDPNRNVIDSASDAIQSFNSSAITILTDTIKKNLQERYSSLKLISAYYTFYYKDIITQCIHQLSLLQEKRSVETLIFITKSPFPPYKIEAGKALINISKNFPELIINSLEKSNDDREIMFLLKCLKGVNLNQFEKQFTRIYSNGSSTIKSAVLYVLSSSSPSWSYKIFRDTYKSENNELKTLCLRGLCLFSDNEMKKIYLHHISSSKNEQIYYSFIGLFNLKDNKSLELLKNKFPLCEEKTRLIILLCLKYYSNKEIVSFLDLYFDKMTVDELEYANALIRHKLIISYKSKLMELSNKVNDQSLNCEIQSTLNALDKTQFLSINNNCNPVDLEFIKITID